ncbi:MAG TPA: TauD/TfdA family dioxygenase [Kribbellaceae bacterium]|nr:TauD/TfdA family dioxygenase [Kribbellaceae bacterium]
MADTTDQDSWRYGAIPAAVTVALSNQDLAAFERVALGLSLKYGEYPLGHPALLAEVELATRSLPERLLARLIDFRTAGNDAGTLLLRNLTVHEPLPPTPASDAAAPDWSALPVSTLTQLAVMTVLGEVIAYADEKDGRLVQDVCPVAGAEQRQENTGSRLLELHTEDGFHPYKPELISLFCLRPDHDGIAATVTGSARAALRAMPADCHRTLRAPVYRIRFSSSFTGDGPARYSGVMPVLSGPADDPDLCVDFHAMEAVRADGAAALARLRTAMQHALIGAVLRPGDLIVVDNRVAVHGRTDFNPRYDGADRWLRRCFAVADLRPSRGVRPDNSRVLAPID